MEILNTNIGVDTQSISSKIIDDYCSITQNPDQTKKEVASDQTKPRFCIPQDLVEKVDPDDYKFYEVVTDSHFNRLAKRFTPNDDDIYVFKGTESQVRLIHTGEYSDGENEKYNEFISKLDDITDPDVKLHILNQTKSQTMRMIIACGYDFQRIVKEVRAQLDWKDSIIPELLTPTMKAMINKGLFYISGRDRSLRSIHVMRPHIMTECGGTYNEVLGVMNFVDSY